MQALEFEETIDRNGVIHMPQAYRSAYGQQARFVVLLPENASTANETGTDAKPGSAILNHPAIGMWADMEGDSRGILNQLRQKQWMRP